MKQKITYLIMLCLLMTMGISAQQQQRARNVVKAERTPETSYKTAVDLQQQANTNEYIVQCHDDVLQYTPKRASASQSIDSVTVTLVYNLQEEDFGNWYVSRILIYNLDWSSIWYPSMFMSDGGPVRGISVKIPIGTYDFYSQSVTRSNGMYFTHIDELVTIDKDTTINMNVKAAENLVNWELCDENGKIINDSTTIAVSGLKVLWLEDYGSVEKLNYSFRGGVAEGLPHLGFRYCNTLSNRYHYFVVENTINEDNSFYVNRLSSPGSGPFPLKNTASDYVQYSEQFQRTPKGIQANQNPLSRVYSDRYIENEKIATSHSEGSIPLEDDHIVKVMVNAPKLGDNQSLHGVNAGVGLEIEDGEKIRLRIREYYDDNDSLIFVRVDTIRTRLYTQGPEMMVGSDRKIEFIVNYASVATSEAGIWQDDYPGHPKFSYMAEKKQGILGNSCPLNVVRLRNRDQEGMVRMINTENEHWGRYGEVIGCEDIYSTMTAKYNGEEIYFGKMALDSLCDAWAQQPRGEYELTFVNDNASVDGIEGKNVTTICFDQTREDMNMPRLKMLQFRDAEDNVTDHFSTPDQGNILFAGGDFEMRTLYYTTDEGYESEWSYNDCQPMTVEVSYAPYGTDEWQPLESIEHQSEFDDPYLFGSFYSGSLTSVNTPSENGWFDLKFRLVDEAGNWQEQTLSPAFRIDALVQSAVTEVRDGSTHEVARYSIDGKRVDTSHRGVTIIRMSDGTARKVIL